MGWWRRLGWFGGNEAATHDAARAAAMARLRGQCGLGAGECAPWNAPEPDPRSGEGEENEEAGDERR